MRILKALISSWLFCALAAAGATLSTGQKSSLDAEIRSLLDSQHLPSISVAIARDGHILYLDAAGSADVKHGRKATPKTLYRLASISKPLTAVAVLQLASIGKLELDQPVEKYCPAFSGHPEVTARQLLAHRSGIPFYKSDATLYNTRHFDTLNAAVRNVAAIPLEFSPGTGYQYSSYGYTVLGCAIEGASGEPYDRYMQSHVFAPAGMRHTLVDTRVPARRKAEFYSWKQERIQDALPLDSSDRLPGGGWLSTPEQLVKFADAVMEHRLLNESWTEQMWHETTLAGESSHYALGWALDSLDGHGVVEHAGGQSGTSTILILVPDERLAVAVFSNRDGADMTQVGERLVHELLQYEH